MGVMSETTPVESLPDRSATEAAQRYRVIERLESGGMAEVFRAESTGLEGFRKQVAIKRVLPHLGRNSQINRSVPPELETIVNRALARDRHERYSSARELGQDLSRFMFRFAQPVSGYDIATIVQATMRERENARLAKGSFIHKLIEEALLEFTLIPGDRGAQSNMLVAAGAPLNAELFVQSPGLPTAQQEELAAPEGDEVRSAPIWRRWWTLGIGLLLLAAAAFAWFAVG